MTQLFKGIALFTPGGDLIYCIDPSKQGRWHMHLCAGLQEHLGLPEPPHFLIPGYTATLDHWLDPITGKLRTAAEIYPPVQRYQALLNAVFSTNGLVWEVAPWQEESCNPMVIETYHQQFAPLWQAHELIVRLETAPKIDNPVIINQPSAMKVTNPSYVLRLFVSGNTSATAKTLERLHQLLETRLDYPYTLKVIDIYKNPEQAELNQVSATPTLVRVFPKPVRRIVGEFEDMEQLLQMITSNSEF